MAEKLSAFPSGRRVSNGESIEQWLDGSVYMLRRGVDYKISDDAFRNRISTEALRRGIYIRTRRVEGGYVLQAFSPGVPGAGPDEDGAGLVTPEVGEDAGEDRAADEPPARARGRAAS